MTAAQSQAFPAIEDDEHLSAWLDDVTPRLRDGVYRQHAVETLSTNDWQRIGRLWAELAGRIVADSEDDGLLRLTDSLARWSRNVCVEPAGRTALLPVAGPALRSLLGGRLTAFQSLADVEYRPVVRSLAQLLANLAGSRESANVLLPETVGAVPYDKNIVVRLFASEDGSTLEATVTFLLIALSEAPERSTVFLAGPGLSIVELLLRRMERWFEAEGASEERCFELGYEVAKLLFEEGHLSSLYDSLADGIAGSPISLPQSLLLKLFDAYLHSSNSRLGSAALDLPGLAFLLPTTERLLAALLRPMRALKPTPTEERGAKPKKTPFEDVTFGKCAEGFSLGLKAVIQIALFGAERVDGNDDDDEAGFNGARRREAGQRLVGELLQGSYLDASLELLTLSDIYEPRLVRTAVSSVEADNISPVSSTTTTHAFASVRKDIVRLFGIIAASSPVAQTSLADKGALEVLLGMCALDVQNPFLREHALFAVRSLLIHNPANQARVRELEPQATIDDQGQLGSVPDRWRK